MCRYVKIKLFQHQFDALASLTFNIGPTRLWKTKEVGLLKDINDEKHNQGEQGREKIRQDFMLYVKARGEYFEGLKSRRGREARLFLDGVYDW